MTDAVIRAEGIGKRYRIGARRASYGTLREAVVSAARRIATAPFRAAARLGRGASEDDFIWALKDVSFEVARGEVVGIIGRNGAGKTTLLKVLSRITEPTEGTAEIRGRVGSLLEVGAGFHPELTGRENVYLNGAILGMKRREISAKFDEIVAFAEVDRFIDTPIKRYSAGMRTRLAFAVAAHLEPEILLIDEVLAVGDAAFQKKCLGKMGDVAVGGRTVLFVSHQMNSVRKLCDRSIWLDCGRVQMVDSTTRVVAAYQSATTDATQREATLARDAHVPARFLSWAIVEPPAEQKNMLTSSSRMAFKVVVKINKPVRKGHHGIALSNSDGQLVWAWAVYGLKLEPGVHEFEYTLNTLPLHPGNYSWCVSLYDEGKLLDKWQCVPEMVVATEPLTHPRDEWSGILNIPCKFQQQRVAGQ